MFGPSKPVSNEAWRSSGSLGKGKLETCEIRIFSGFFTPTRFANFIPSPKRGTPVAYISELLCSAHAIALGIRSGRAEASSEIMVHQKCKLTGIPDFRQP